MNNSYTPYQNQNAYQNQNFVATPSNQGIDYSQNIPLNQTFQEDSYIENILRLNKGKLGRFYCTFPDSNDWRDSVFNGIVEQAGRDHLIVRNPSTGKWYIILMIYLNYVEFDDAINYITNF